LRFEISCFHEISKTLNASDRLFFGLKAANYKKIPAAEFCIWRFERGRFGNYRENLQTGTTRLYHQAESTAFNNFILFSEQSSEMHETWSFLTREARFVSSDKRIAFIKFSNRERIAVRWRSNLPENFFSIKLKCL
jgi:hypothetical protein